MKIVSSLKTGYNTLSFKLPLTEENIAMFEEEFYVETKDYRYVVKEILQDKNDFFTVYCNPNIEDLKMNLIPAFDAYDINIEAALRKAVDLLSLPWAIVYHSTLQDKVEYAIPQTTPYDIITQIKNDFNLEIWYDTLNKKIHVYDSIGEDKGVALLNELRLKSLVRQGNSYDFATVLYPIGKDGLTIAEVNNGSNTVSNHSYCNKILTKYYINEDIEYAEELKKAAEDYLSIISSPIVGYKVELSSLPDNIQLGDNILLIDKIKKIRQKQRVVKITHFPLTPEKDQVELSNEIADFAETFTRFNSDYRKQIAYVKSNLRTLI
jgi:phage minor structural protein